MPVTPPAFAVGSFQAVQCRSRLATRLAVPDDLTDPDVLERRTWARPTCCASAFGDRRCSECGLSSLGAVALVGLGCRSRRSRRVGRFR